MKRVTLVIVLSFLSVGLAGAFRTALDRYWDEDYSGRLGIQVSGKGSPLMRLAGRPLYVSGVNCYDLFIQSVSSSMSTVDMEASINVLIEEEVPVVRFSGMVYHADEMRFYMESKAEYLSNLKTLAELCDEADILLVPSVFWQINTVPSYFDEPMSAWGDVSSRTYRFMAEYTEDFVNVLKDHKCIAAWEFGNEFNLAADIALAGYPDISATAIGTALKGFAEIVQRLDPHHRMISSGHSVMRNAQWHLANERNWDVDSYDQYVEMIRIMTPEPVSGLSEHLYEDPRIFSDLGTLDTKDQIRAAMRAAGQLGKVYYVGEFTGPYGKPAEVVKQYYDLFHELGVQLSLIWNYSYRGNIVDSFMAGTEPGDVAFGYMRELNGKFASARRAR